MIRILKSDYGYRFHPPVLTAVIAGATLLVPSIAGAQTTTPTPPPPVDEKKTMDPMQSMSSSIDLLAPMTQEASGTAWLPASSPMYGKMFMNPDGSMLMLHGAITPRFVNVGSKRGDRDFGSPNWFMGMYQRPLGPKDQIGFRAMLSLDPITEGGYGYPLLFQTGESWHNQPLHDRQHPHDLFSELSVSYSHQLSENTSTYLYFGYPGEPAIGPPTFMHRLIAYDLPDAPIGHHWQDATHITFGVATLGLNLGNRWKVEGSLFNGREPNENRYDFDTFRLDSQSGRVFYNPDANNSLQLSYGFQKNPEGDGVNLHRTVASWVYNRPLGPDANFTTTLSWGQNNLANAEGKSNSYLAEADYQSGRHTYFSRLENIQKSGHELVLPEEDHGNKYTLGAYTVGYMYDLAHGKGIDTGVGASLTVNTKPSSLDPFYGTQSAPVSFQVMFRLRPSRARMDSGMSGMDHNGMDHGGGMKNMPGMDHTGHDAAPNTGGTKSDAPVPPTKPETPPAEPSTPSVATPPTTPPAEPATPSAPTAATLNLTATATPNPPKARQKTKITLAVTGTDGKPLPGATIKASANMTTMNMGVLKPTFKDLGDGKYQAEITFSMPGPWRLSVTVTPPTDAKAVAVTMTFDYNVAR